MEALQKESFYTFERPTQKSHYIQIWFTEVLYKITIFLLENINILQRKPSYSNLANSFKGLIKAMRTAHCFSRYFPVSGVVLSFNPEIEVL